MAELVIKGGDASSTPAGDPAGRRRGRATAGSWRVGPDLDGDEVLDAGGCVRRAPAWSTSTPTCASPGTEEAETVETGSRAAALGGYTAVVAMPNTEPGHRLRRRWSARCSTSAGGALCDVRVAGAITVGRAGEQLAPLAEMAALGVRLFTDDGTGVQDARLMRRALEYACGLGRRAGPALRGRGPRRRAAHMHEGEWSSRLGMPGQPAEAEELMVMRDLALARLTGARVHFQHLSTARSVELVRAAQAGGARRSPPRRRPTTSR